MVKRYLDLISLERALGILREEFGGATGRTVQVPLGEAAGRITAAPIFARFSVPAIHISAMDGIAVRSAETKGASETRPVTITDAVRVNTGNIVPSEYDAVVMIEDVWIGEGSYTVRKAVTPWQHVRPVGEDIGESEMILPSLHQIRPHELGALAAYGVTGVEVLALSAGIIPTGSELVPIGTRPGPGQAVESNTLMAAAHLRALGVDVRRNAIVPDEPDLIRAAIEEGIRENEILIISAGSSAGTRDYTASIIAERGEVLVHGVGIKPAKPVIIGRIDGKPVIGLPGYPLAALTVLREIITPLVALYGFPVPEAQTVEATLTTTLHSDIGTDEFVLLSVGRIGEDWVAVPQSRGAGVQMSAVRANAVMTIPASREGAEAGDTVQARLMVPRRQAREAVLITGSHDPCIDRLADLVRPGGVEIHPTHVGSMGGLLTLKKGQCHAAPMHLLAPDGEYNTPFLRKYLPDTDLVLVCVAEREQGLISREGASFDDLTTMTYANRQKGSGTRLLLDHLLQERGIQPAAVRGYDREFTTHLAVALAVRSGEADCGMGVYSAAQALGLHFAPVATERYELVMRADALDDPRMAAILDAIRSERFSEILEGMGGYRTAETGGMRVLP
ncbi:molybdopterin biosynthesis protein [Methanofollis fontis]|uniref:Molybdopterin biosynthesis protein n=1 Tax=Methanofollis fontis TaxID=2052832 RepID=A0A483CNB2_9EURY|nr:molybdopterin biosynthesis protein [Methanofollis fontis]TAJ43461.1 molybdopterin biosynthesis protein [Methanofollis fontis]